MAVTVTHSKTLVSPSTGSEDKVYGADYVAADSHNLNGLGTGVEAALEVNVGSAGAVVVNGGALGTPSSGTLTNCTGLPVAGSGTGASTAIGAAANLAVVYILDKNGVPITAPANDTNNNVIETIPVAAGVIGNNGALRYFCRTTLSNNANAKTVRVYIGAAGAGTGGTLIGSHSVANTQQSTISVLISNSNAANVQETTVVGQTNINVISTRVAGAIDTSAAWELVIAMQKATGTDTMTLQHSTTELLSDGT